MSRKCIGFILIKEYPRSKKLGSFEPYTTGEFLKYPEIWRPVFENEQTSWVETESNCRTFTLGDEPELIHIIETGFYNLNKYMIIFEDAYELDLGKVIFASKEQIYTKFGIKL